MPRDKEAEALLQEAVRKDAEIADRVRGFAHKVMDKAEFLLERGNPYIQANMVRSLMPSMAKALHERNEDDDEIQALREELQALRQEMHADPDEEDTDAVPATVTPLIHSDERPASSPVRAELGAAQVHRRDRAAAEPR